MKQSHRAMDRMRAGSLPATRKPIPVALAARQEKIASKKLLLLIVFVGHTTMMMVTMVMSLFAVGGCVKRQKWSWRKTFNHASVVWFQIRWCYPNCAWSASGAPFSVFARRTICCRSYSCQLVGASGYTYALSSLWAKKIHEAEKDFMLSSRCWCNHSCAVTVFYLWHIGSVCMLE